MDEKDNVQDKLTSGSKFGQAACIARVVPQLKNQGRNVADATQDAIQDATQNKLYTTLPSVDHFMGMCTEVKVKFQSYSLNTTVLGRRLATYLDRLRASNHGRGGLCPAMLNSRQSRQSTDSVPRHGS